MADPEQEAQWRKQFEAIGRREVHDHCRDGGYHGPQRGFAYRWLKETDVATKSETTTHTGMQSGLFGPPWLLFS